MSAAPTAGPAAGAPADALGGPAAGPAEGTTASLISWAGRLDYGDLPDAVVRAARRAVLDSLGVTLGGSRSEAVDILLGQLDALGGASRAALVGRRRRTDVVSATLVNAVMAHVLDFDDTLLPTRVHPSAPLLPALLAVGEDRAVRQRDLLAAFVVGVELQSRLAMAMYPQYADRGWHGTGVVGPVAVAVAVGRLLGLDDERMAHAVGLGATSGAGITAVFGSMAKSLNLGRAGASGVQCALLAERGFTSVPAALDPPAGWFRRYSDARDDNALLGELGTRWAVVSDGFKPYACGLVAHAAIDGVLALRSSTGLTPDEIAALHLRVPPQALVLMGNPSPRTELEAKFSVAYCAAASFIDGSAGPETFSEERVGDPRYRALLDRVEVEPDPRLHQDEAVVTVTARSGQRHHLHVKHALGTLDNPMTDDDLAAKFRGLAVPVLGDPGADAVFNYVWRAESEPVTALAEALQPAEDLA